MKLYFARHGETDSNLQKSVVSFNDRLTALGCKQAQELAERVSDNYIDVILASPHKRTKETAEIVAKKINLNIQEISLLGEKKWPSAIEGKPLMDPEVEKVLDLLKEKNNSDPGWHYSDEENFLDIKKRARLFVEYVSGRAEKNILAISHEYFIKAVIATMMFNDQLSYDIFRSFFHFASLANTSLTLCAKEQTTWKLVTLNDQ
jgi:probable phosphoglycerate mutase